ncbi:TonB-dependent receptor plug domain-containing protein [Billgrantia desiderata]|uniref:TonB-dependent receptor plug domain-containing protein n=1 Tax=Billgrantia desiderata TaxID=52021 RepID=UPI001F2CA81F|nr:TonB-dependent receptor [Halomonas desiderata]MCE8011924.1 TonB-dependent receptor [Halomonas desiderata]
MELPTKGGGLGVLMAPLFAVAAIPAAVADTVPSAELRPGALETMVVLGTGTQTSIFENPASITALEAHELRRTPTTSVAELLRDVPGVRLFDDGTAGMKRISIRGETSRRVTIKVDGHALTDHSPYGTPLLLDPAIIERIEVVRGPSSVLSGSNAIGGVVNIITRRGGERPLEGSVSATGFSATRDYHSSATLQGASGAVDWRVTGSLADEGDRRTPEGRLSPSGFEQDQLSTHFGFRQGDHYVALKAEQYRLEADVYNPLPEGFTEFSIRLPQRDLRKVGLFYEGEPSSPAVSRVEASLYHQTVDRLFENQAAMTSGMTVGTTSDDRQTTYGADLQLELAVTGLGSSVLGLEYENDALATDKTSDVFMPFPPPAGQRSYTATSDEARIQTLSGYAQQAWELNDDTTAYFGGRVYAVEAELEASSDKALERNTDTRALGSLGLVYTPGDSWSLRANLAQGYSYPTLQQLFLTTTAGGQTTVGNPELLPEKANTVELGARYRDGRLTLDATLFHTRAEDYIGQEVDNTSGPQPIRRYVNIHQATTTGLELFGEHRLTATDTAFYLSGSVLRREYDFGESQTYDSGTPRLAGRLGVRQEWMPASAMRLEGDLFLRGESEVRERNAAGELTSRTAGFGTLNAYLGLQYADRLDVGLSLDNLLDKRYRSFGELTGEERSVTLTTTLHF